MFKFNRHCERQRSNLNLPSRKWIAASLTLLAMTSLMSFPAQAKDKKEPVKNLTDILEETAMADGAVKYEPENCGFEMVFPSKPHTAQRCVPKANGGRNCTDLTSYTMVYDVTTTVEISVTCVPSTPEQYKRYTENVIKIALNGMVSRGDVTDHEINTLEEDNVRQGSLLGTATRGKQNSIYNAQLWIGQNSIMTLEAKLIGPAHDEADQIFGDILASVKKK